MKKTCIKRGSSQVIFYGKTSCNYQRFKCKICNHAYTFHNHKNKIHRERKWFELWIIEGYSIRQLISISKYGIWKIKRIKSYWLEKIPPVLHLTDKHKYLIFDGTYFKRANCLIIAMDNISNRIIANRYCARENYATTHDAFKELMNKLVNPKAITVDGNTSAIRTIKKVWPNFRLNSKFVRLKT